MVASKHGRMLTHFRNAVRASVGLAQVHPITMSSDSHSIDDSFTDSEHPTTGSQSILMPYLLNKMFPLNMLILFVGFTKRQRHLIHNEHDFF